MGFYGNITNTNKTQFTFDKIYSSRKAMDDNANGDGIYLGRYVLIEYDSTPIDRCIKLYKNNGLFYLSPNHEKETRVRYSTDSNNDGTEVQQGQIIYIITANNTYEFYKCTGRDPEGWAKFDGPLTDSNYTKNYKADIDAYGEGRGYDSTVWQKVYVQDKEKYVMIAELNTVVPTFDLQADAPTMEPITPHFDTNSTNVYYRLHWQPQWGLRVAAAENGAPSDATTVWQEASYNASTDQTTITKANKNAAIYFNKAGFDPTKSNHVNDENNTISILPTGKSGNKYPKHDGTDKIEEREDIQEMRINLPAIGNMMSDAWDIIHGPNRDDNPANSLQGRLDFFTKTIKENEIPVQTQNGYLNGAHIEDDKWITTNIDGNAGVIRVEHAFTDGEHTKPSYDMNSDNGGKLELYVPNVDDKGHVVGENITTVTLPFGFKTIVAENSNENSDPAMEAESDIIADTTQDTLTIAASNKWIKLDTSTEDTIQLGHLLKSVTNSTSEATLSNEKSETVKFDIPIDSFDEAGHHNGRDVKTITVPFGYGQIKGDSGSTAATATYDELTFASDEWLTATVEQDKVTYVHNYPKRVDDTTSTLDVNGNGDKITLETLTRDDMGHVTKVDKQTVTLPFGYKTFKGDTGESSANNTQDTMSIIGDNWISSVVSNNQISLTHKKPVDGDATNKDNVTPSFGDTFNIDDHYFDDKGHKFASKTHTVKIPLPSLEPGTGNIVTGLALDAAAGKFTESKANLGAIKLGTYEGSDNTEDLTADLTLQNALRRLENKNKKTNDRIDTLIGALDSEKTASENKYISSIKIEDGKLSEIGETELPIRTVTAGETAGTIAVNDAEIAIPGWVSISADDVSKWNGLEANVQADWDATEGAAVIVNKPTNLVTSDSKFIYIPAEKDAETNEETKPAETQTIEWLFAKVKKLEDKLSATETKIAELEQYHTTTENGGGEGETPDPETPTT